MQIVDAAPHYGLLSVQGPKAESGIRSRTWIVCSIIPTKPLNSVKISDTMLGEIYLANNSSNFVSYDFGFDLFVPNNSLGAVADKLIFAAKQIGGCACGWTGV